MSNYMEEKSHVFKVTDPNTGEEVFKTKTKGTAARLAYHKSLQRMTDLDKKELPNYLDYGKLLVNTFKDVNNAEKLSHGAYNKLDQYMLKRLKKKYKQESVNAMLNIYKAYDAGLITESEKFELLNIFND